MGRARDDTRYLAARKALKARDHTCHLCGGEIDMQLINPDPGAWTCDHLIPTSKMPKDDPRQWDINLLRAAHRWCNLSRGAKPVGRPGLNASRQWGRRG
jgi:hypothetical protein